MFEDDLVTALEQWRTRGDRIILMMDANNNVFNSRLTKLLKDKLEMCEAVHGLVLGQGPNTHVDGSVPIDGIWYTPDLTLERASYLPFDPQLGDHRPVMADSHKNRSSELGYPVSSLPKHGILHRR